VKRSGRAPSPASRLWSALAGVALLALAGCASAPATGTGPGTSIGASSAVVWSADSAAVGGLGARRTVLAYDGTTGRELWRFRIDSTHFAGLKRDAAIERVRLLPEGRGALLALGGDLWLWSAEGRGTRRLTTTEAPERDAEPAPSGDQVAFVRDGDLFALDLRTGEELRLTTKGELGDGDRSGGRLPRFLWAPESRTIAFPFAAPGTGVGVVDLPGQSTLRLESGDIPSERLLSYAWRPDGRGVGIERLSPDGARIELLLCHPEKLYCRPLAARPAPAAPSASFRFLTDGFLWGESTGDGLGRYDTVGRETGALLPAGWRVRDLLAIDGEESWVIVTADSVATPARVATMAIRFGGAPTSRLLAPDRALAAASFAPTQTRWVRVEHGAAVLVSLDGGRIAELPGLRPAPETD